MIALLRLAVLFNIKRQDGIIPDLKIKCDGDQLALTFPEDWLLQKPIFTADLEQESEQLKVLGVEVLYQ
jgi:exopolyphosphatase/guanosine-5'-triphosphate,3'-diphosphate pyrophosphatase